MKKHIPNFITSLNIASGCAGIGMAFYGDLIFAAYMIGLASVFDFLDGAVARLLNAKTGFGKELDSLADVVSFGVLPGVIIFCLLNMVFRDEEGWIAFVPFVAFLIPVFSALRLAKFNIDTRQAEGFIGLPTPANAILIASIPLIIAYQPEQNTVPGNLLSNPVFLIMLVFILSFLLVSPLPLFSLKFKNLSWSANSFQYVFIILSLVLLIFFTYSAIPVIMLLYILLSIIKNSQKTGEKNDGINS